MSITAVSPVHAIASHVAEHRPPAVAAAAPDLPRPVTPATAAVHLMQVPSSRVLEAVASLQRAMGLQARGDEIDDRQLERLRDVVAERAQRLAKAVAPVTQSAEIDVKA